MSDTKHWFTARKGSHLAYWKPAGLLEGIIEVHPDHPPIMHWCGGKSEELKVAPDGAFIVTPQYTGVIEIALGASVDMAGINDPDSWVDMQTDEPKP